MQAAQSVVLSAGQAEHNNEAFHVQLEAAFPNNPSADTTCKQLQIQTQMLKLELAHENHEPNPADLTGLLAAGTFQVGSQPCLRHLACTKRTSRASNKPAFPAAVLKHGTSLLRRSIGASRSCQNP